MILGVLDRNGQSSDLKRDLLQVLKRMPQARGTDQAAIWANKYLAFFSIPPQIDTLDEVPQPFTAENQSSVASIS